MGRSTTEDWPIDASLSIDVQKFNTAMSRAPLYGSVMTRFDGSKNSGVFRVSYQHQHLYFFTKETSQVMYPSPLNQAWKEMVMRYAANVVIQHLYYLHLLVVAVNTQMQMKVKESHHQSVTGLLKLQVKGPSVLLVIGRVAQKHTICFARQEYLTALSVERVLISRGASLKLCRKHLSVASRFYSPFTSGKTAGVMSL
jgi:hypothetical protein